MKHLFLTSAFILALAILVIAGGVTAAHADGGPEIPRAHQIETPDPGVPFFFTFPIHGPGDLVIPKFQHNYGDHPEGCFPPLVLNEHGQCALPGDDTPPDPIWHRIGF